MRVSTVVLAAIASAVLSLSSTAQNQSSAPVMKARVDLVLVPVIVRDSKGGPVRGLSAADFILEDNGARQRIASVEEVITDSQPLLAQAAPSDSTFVTQFSNSDRPKNLVILVLDLINTTELGQSRARQAILKFLATQVKNDRLVGLVVIEPGRVRLLHAFTSSPSILSAALQRVVGISSISTASLPVPSASLSSIETAAADVEARGLNQFVQQANDEMSRAIASVHASRRTLDVKATLESLQHIASWVAGIPGRKTLIWLTGQVPYLTTTGDRTLGYISSEDWDRTSRSLANANVALYPVDVRGLLNTSFLAEGVTYTGWGPDINNALRGDLREVQRFDHHAMNMLAQETGGKAFYNSNEIGKCVAQAAADSEHYYVLAYYLEWRAAKPGWHRLRVRVSRHGVTTQARSGFVVAKVREDSIEARRAAEDLAMASPLEYTALPLTLRWKSITMTGDTRSLEFELFIPAGAVSVGSDTSHVLSLDFITLATNAEGTMTTRMNKPVRRMLKPDAVQQIQVFGITYADSLKVKPGEYVVRLVVRDNFTGRLGSVTAPLRVAP